MRIPNYLKRLFFVVSVFLSIFVFKDEIIYFIEKQSEITDIDGLYGEIIGGITTTSIIFIFYLFITPIVEVSPKILKYPNGIYKFKIYNSSVFAAFDVRASLTKVTPIRAPGGSKFNVSLQSLDISLPYMEYLPSMYNLNSRNNGNTFATVYHVKNNENILKILNDDSDLTYYRFTISCKNGFTGLRKITTKNYNHINDVADGKEFASGATFKNIKRIPVDSN